jgi:hypothetical protein
MAGEARATTSYLPEIAAGHQILKISPEVIEFPTLEMKEQAQVLSHLDLVLSQIPMESLQGLQAGVAQEIQFCAESMTKELTKVAVEKEDL